jgi:hypothetical protein
MTPVFVLAIVCLLGTADPAQLKYFPNGVLSADRRTDEFMQKRYSEQLAALREPSLWESSKTQQTQSYRFLWLRTFHHPIAIRVDVNPDGTSQLTTKMTSGKGGYAPGKLIKNLTVTLSKEQTDWFIGKIELYRFWQLPSVQETGGNDGAQWVVEGIKDHAYHIVDRWTPKDGDVRAIGLVLINDLAKLDIAPAELY